MTQDETSLFNDMMGTRTYVYSHEPRHNPHAIAANLQQLAYDKCKKFSNDFKERDGTRSPAMDIGGNSLRTHKDDHICTLINGCREESRYTIANLYNPASQMNLLNTPLHHTMCMYGAQHCERRFRYAYMINVYDITPKIIVDIFEKHQLEVLDYWIFMPLCLLEPGLTIDQTFYKCKLITESHNNTTTNSLNTTRLVSKKKILKYQYYGLKIRDSRLYSVLMIYPTLMSTIITIGEGGFTQP